MARSLIRFLVTFMGLCFTHAAAQPADFLTTSKSPTGLTYAQQQEAFFNGAPRCKLGEGIWETAGGELRCMECPSEWESGLARLPKGCLSWHSGVFIKREKYVEREGDLAVLKKQLETAEKQLALFKERVAKLEDQVRYCRVEKAVEGKDTSWTWAFPIGFAAGASLLLLRN